MRTRNCRRLVVVPMLLGSMAAGTTTSACSSSPEDVEENVDLICVEQKLGDNPEDGAVVDLSECDDSSGGLLWLLFVNSSDRHRYPKGTKLSSGWKSQAFSAFDSSARARYNLPAVGSGTRLPTTIKSAGLSSNSVYNDSTSSGG